ncbi:hypothetical protein IPH92_04385 [Candidatus Kaiserbacteria bacterium]|nr:MAG: hypothetical protein IPH92_04385 [Candidatus Kaiserbacteria bacterium]
MKFNFKTQLKQRIRSFEEEKDSHEYMHPQRDWMLILGSAVFVFLGGVTYSAFDFYTQFVMPPEPSLVEDKVVRYRDTAILEVAKLYDDREQLFTTLRADKPPVSVPIEVPATTTAEIKIEEAPPLAEEGTPLYTETAPTLSP